MYSRTRWWLWEKKYFITYLGTLNRRNEGKIMIQKGVRTDTYVYV